MSDKPKEDADSAQDADNHGKKGSKKKLIIIIVAAVLLIGGGAGAYFGGLFGSKSHKEAAKEGEENHGEEKAEEGHGGGESEGGHDEEGGEGGEHGKTAGPTFMELPEFLVNLNTGSRQTSFLKMTVTLELASAGDKAKVEANLPRVMDSFNTYLRELRASDLYGSAGVYRLREELLTRINKAVEPVKVNDILFKQILVQ